MLTTKNQFLRLMLLWLGICGHAYAEVIAVDFVAKGASNSGPTMTMLWPAMERRATLIVILGGAGSIKMSPDTVVVRKQTANMVKILTDPAQSKAMVNVVIFNSPYSLDGGLAGIGPRYSGEHLSRIDSVVRFYKERLKTPIWLMGHSNGSISVAEFINAAEVNRDFLAGAILSGSRDEAGISAELSFPVLGLHHQNDGCRSTRYSSASDLFDRIKSANKSRTGFKTVQGGTERGDPCTNGFHMYADAFPEAAKMFEEFLLN